MCRRFAILALFLSGSCAVVANDSKPNVVLIYADDIGYGDVSCYGAKRVTTPHIDRIAAEGIRFTDGHCSSGTCTPSRFSMLTGEYAFRKSGTGVLPGNAPLIIPPTTHTLAKVFQKAGYTTGVVGKWHLGLGGPNGPDWNGVIQPGPAEVPAVHGAGLGGAGQLQVALGDQQFGERGEAGSVAQQAILH